MDKASHIMAKEKIDTEENLSERIFEAMCEIVGTSQIVAQRREIMNLNEKLCSFKEGGFAQSQILAGSTRDGFRFDQSDVDVMICCDDTRVIWDSFQFSNTTECKTLFDNSKSPPGYGLLQILGKQKAESSNLVITIKGKSYLSGSALKAYICSISPLLRIHGPCASFDNGITNVDLAVCLKSDDWPPLASPFVGRCNKKAWPNPDLIQDIIKSGCHVVPVGSKSENEDVEWRISFSVAERKLVHDMSHSQFLLYGLLKLFLDEVINNCCAKTNCCVHTISKQQFFGLSRKTFLNAVQITSSNILGSACNFCLSGLMKEIVQTFSILKITCSKTRSMALLNRNCPKNCKDC